MADLCRASCFCHLRICFSAPLYIQKDSALGRVWILHSVLCVRYGAVRVLLHCRLSNMGLCRSNCGFISRGHWRCTCRVTCRALRGCLASHAMGFIRGYSVDAYSYLRYAIPWVISNEKRRAGTRTRSNAEVSASGVAATCGFAARNSSR